MGATGKSSGRLTTHVLDLASGKPAKGLSIRLARVDGARKEIAKAVTNADGRCDEPLLSGQDMAVGLYELTFAAGGYFDSQTQELPEPKFLDDVVIRFGIADPGGHYHVPLLLSPYGYSTYRGS